MSTPPGWYPDPSSPTDLRWWTGTAWSEQAAPRPGTAPMGSPWQRPDAPSATPPGTGAGTVPPPPPPPPPPPQLPAAAAYPTGAQGTPGPLAVDLSTKASYIRRLAALTLDSLFCGWPAFVGSIVTVAILGVNDTSTDPDTIDLDLSGGAVLAIVLSLTIGYGASLALTIWNLIIRQGRTGQSLGKKPLGLALVDAGTGAPCGGLRAFGRYATAFVLGGASSGLFSILDWLWPLWDQRGQRVVDKILSTVVAPVRRP